MNGFLLVLNNGTPGLSGSALASRPAVTPLGVVFGLAYRIQSLVSFSVADQLLDIGKSSRLFIVASNRGQVQQGRVVAPSIGSTLLGEARDESDRLNFRVLLCTRYAVRRDFRKQAGYYSNRDVSVACTLPCYLLYLARERVCDVEDAGKLITTSVP